MHAATAHRILTTFRLAVVRTAVAGIVMHLGLEHPVTYRQRRPPHHQGLSETLASIFSMRFFEPGLMTDDFELRNRRSFLARRDQTF